MPTLKPLYLFISLSAIFVLTFMLTLPFWEKFETVDSIVSLAGQTGVYFWFFAFILLALDILLPLPGSLLMAALGYHYGPVMGGCLAVSGGIISGCIGYWLGQSGGVKVLKRFTGNQYINEVATIMQTSASFWMIVVCRWVPVLPEVTSIMAGIGRMPFKRFVIALLCGVIPYGFVMAYGGHQANTDSGLLWLILAGMPIILAWFSRKLW